MAPQNAIGTGNLYFKILNSAPWILITPPPYFTFSFLADGNRSRVPWHDLQTGQWNDLVTLIT